MSTFVERISAVVKLSPASARTFILMRALLIFGMEGISGAQRGAEYSPPTSALRVAECGEIWEGPIVPSCDGLLREPQSGREMEGGSSSAQPDAECSTPSALRVAEGWDERDRRVEEESDRFLEMIAQAVEENQGTWAQIRLWKLDLKGAYTLVSFRPEDVRLMAAEMDDDRFIFFLCGVFGWTGMPAAFQVVTRAIHDCHARMWTTWQVSRAIHGWSSI